MNLVERLTEPAEADVPIRICRLMDEAADRIERLEKALETAREEALEEAAKVAEQLPMLRPVSPVHVKSTSPQDVARFIRALKDKEVEG